MCKTMLCDRAEKSAIKRFVANAPSMNNLIYQITYSHFFIFFKQIGALFGKTNQIATQTFLSSSSLQIIESIPPPMLPNRSRDNRSPNPMSEG